MNQWMSKVFAPSLLMSLPDADKIQFVEMYDLDSKQFAEKKKEYQQIFLR
jgi:hypothetical protein